MVVAHQQYVTGGVWPTTYHSQIDCPRIRVTIDRGDEPRLVRIHTDEEGETWLRQGNQQRRIAGCSQCPVTLEWRWQDDAACLGQGVDMVTPSFEEADDLVRQFCRPCPVRLECAKFAMSRPPSDMAGIWGGVFLPLPYGKNRERRKSALRELAAMLRMAGYTEDAA